MHTYMYICLQETNSFGFKWLLEKVTWAESLVMIMSIKCSSSQIKKAACFFSFNPFLPFYFFFLLTFVTQTSVCLFVFFFQHQSLSLSFIHSYIIQGRKTKTGSQRLTIIKRNGIINLCIKCTSFVFFSSTASFFFFL